MFDTPFSDDYNLLYKLTHFIIGFIIALTCSYSYLFFLFVLFYQFIQYYFNFRFFLFNKHFFKKGNSFKHTINKLIDYLYGFLFGFIFNYFFF